MAKSLIHLIRAANKSPDPDGDHGIGELIPVHLERSTERIPRLSIVLPVLTEKHTYGGISTALRLFESLAKGFPRIRIVLLNQTEGELDFGTWREWVPDRVPGAARSVACLGDEQTTLTVSLPDYFLATSWNTAVYVREAVATQAQWFDMPKRRFVYFIQDYEPAFYPWSSRFVYAHSTYQDRKGTIAVFNSKLLAGYFRNHGLTFSEEHIYHPRLHPVLRAKRAELAGRTRERVIFVYGRPSMWRNGFELIVEALRLWARTFDGAEQWSLVSAGEPHDDIPLGGSVVLRSQGKLTLEDYAALLSRCWAGISLMISPHPSYPPLEMAEFGAWVITNSFENKRLDEWAPNIVSVDEPEPVALAGKLAWCCSRFEPGRIAAIEPVRPMPSTDAEEFSFAPALLESWLRHDVVEAT